ncbi:MAG: hypothetical protein LUE86_01345 [Clostridiales bacterium]|nr:hypothetical protein [Clostridiales bacterium]
MHLGKFYGIFFAVLITALTPLILFTWTNANMSTLDAEVHQKMDSAVYSAMHEAKMEDDNAFGSEAQQTQVLNAFYGSLSAAFGAMNGNASAETIASYIPCVILADNNGAYVCYGKDYQTWNSKQDAYAVTPITTYSADYVSGTGTSYGVTFAMDGTASIRKNGNLLVNGSYDAILHALEEEDIESLPFLETKESSDTGTGSFEAERRAVIASTVKRLAEKYLNEGFGNVNGRKALNQNGITYTVSLPTGENNLSAPAIFAFFTGNQVRLHRNLAVQCIMSSATIGQKQEYFLARINGQDTYHTIDCPHLSADDKRHPYTMEQAAESGALPCVDCIR